MSRSRAVEVALELMARLTSTGGGCMTVGAVAHVRELRRAGDSPKPFVVDELGCLPLEKQTANLFFGSIETND